MQNKPNLLNTQINVRSAITMNYEQLTMNYANKNKANTNPKQTQITKSQNECKLTYNKGLQKKR